MSSSEIAGDASWQTLAQQAHQPAVPHMTFSVARERRKREMSLGDIAQREAIALAMTDSRSSSVKAAGAVRHIFTEAKEMELAVLMQSIELGNSPVASQIAHRILGAIADSVESRSSDAEAQSVETVTASDAPGSMGPMSPRELHVLRLIARGWSNRQIAEATLRSINTIEAQIKSLYRKLAVKSRTQAVRKAAQQGLLDW